MSDVAEVVEMKGERKEEVEEVLKRERNEIGGKYHPEIIRGIVEPVMEIGQWASPVDSARTLAIPVVVRFAERDGTVREKFEEYVEELMNYFRDNGEERIGGVYAQGLVDMMELDSARGEEHKEAMKGRALQTAKTEALKMAGEALCYRREVEERKAERAAGLGGQAADGEVAVRRATRSVVRESGSAARPAKTIETIQGIQVPPVSAKWQKCPVCEDGTEALTEAEQQTYALANETAPISKPCSACRGRRIISIETGLPPG